MRRLLSFSLRSSQGPHDLACSLHGYTLDCGTHACEKSSFSKTCRRYITFCSFNFPTGPQFFYQMFAIVIYLAAVFSLVNGKTSPSENVVDLGYAKYQGVTIPNTTNTQFLGIRFAAPPTGV